MHTTSSSPGASRGIGRAISVRLASEGCHLVIVARSLDGLEETARQCRAANSECKVKWLQCDMTGDVKSMQDLVSQAVQYLGSLTILVNNAGMFGGGSVLTGDLECWDKCIKLNLWAPMVLTRLCSSHIQNSPSVRHRCIIFIASIASIQSMAGNGGMLCIHLISSIAYAASKHGIKGFAGSVFEDVREHGIKVTSILPGFVNTEMLSGDKLDTNKMIQPQDVAELCSDVITWPNNSCPVEIVIRPQRTPYTK